MVVWSNVVGKTKASCLLNINLKFKVLPKDGVVGCVEEVADKLDNVVVEIDVTVVSLGLSNAPFSKMSWIHGNI